MDFVIAGEEDQSVDSESVNYLKGLQLVYESCKGWDLGQVRLLQPLEQLQVHMDCVNALGDIVSIEDVDDMGGAVRKHGLKYLHFLIAFKMNSKVYPIFIVLDVYSSVRA